MLLLKSPKRLCGRAQSCTGEVRSEAGLWGGQGDLSCFSFPIPQQQVCQCRGRTKTQLSETSQAETSPSRQRGQVALLPPLCSPAPHRDAGWSLSLHGDRERSGREGTELRNSNRHYAFYLQVIGRGPAHVGNSYIFLLFNRDLSMC